jgi:cellulose synthase/poly-beta-1,6-N-acetylglucosamine synthase-like glycosyltransferase
MPEALINPDPLILALLIGFGFCLLVQIMFYWVFFIRMAPGSPGLQMSSPDHPADILPAQQSSPGISVVICAHNAQHHLEKTLQLFLGQDYPEYEVILVNHASDDETGYMLAGLTKPYPHLKVVDIREDLNFFTGKKFPLSIGIRSARYDIVLLTDADCRPTGNQWIRSMSRPFAGNTDITLGYGPYERRPGILNRMIRFDTVQIAIHYLSFARAGIPYMGVGRNLAYRKSLFFREKGFISHYRIPGGDDDLFINRVARKRNTAVCIDPDSFTWSEPKESLGKWITQKRRHLTTAARYRFHHKLLLGMYAGTHLGFWALLAVLLILKFDWWIPVGAMLLHWITQYVVLGRGMSRLRETDLIVFIPILPVCLLLLNTGIMVANLVRKPRKWK